MSVQERIKHRKEIRGRFLTEALAEASSHIPVLTEEALNDGSERMGAQVPRMIPVASTRPTESYTCGHCQSAARRDDGALFCCMIGDGSRPAGRQTWVGAEDTACTAYRSRDLSVVCDDCRFCSCKVGPFALCHVEPWLWSSVRRKNVRRLCGHYAHAPGRPLGWVGIDVARDPDRTGMMEWPAELDQETEEERYRRMAPIVQPEIARLSTTVDRGAMLERHGLMPTMNPTSQSVNRDPWHVLSEGMLRHAYEILTDERLDKLHLQMENLQIDRDLRSRSMIGAVRARIYPNSWQVVKVEVPFTEIGGLGIDAGTRVVLSRLNEKLWDTFGPKHEKPDGIRLIRIRRREEP